MQVCRAAGYFEHALSVARAAGEHELYLDILLEDCSGYDEALTYLQTLPASQAAAVLQKHGKVNSCALSLVKPHLPRMFNHVMLVLVTVQNDLDL